MGMYNKPELLRKLINDFLEEQETMYNKIESIEEFISEIKESDHVLITFNDKSQFEQIVVNFVRRGIISNNIIVLFIAGKDESQFIQALNKIKNINSLFSSEDIVVLRADNYHQDGIYMIEPILHRLESIIQTARDRSKCGLSLIGTLPGELIEEGKHDEAHNIEIRFNEAVHKSEIPATLLCLYRSLPKTLEGRFSRCHDLIIKRAVTSTGIQ